MYSNIITKSHAQHYKQSPRYPCNFYQHLDRSHMLNITNSHPGTHATSINTSTEVTCSTLQTVTPVPMQLLSTPRQKSHAQHYKQSPRYPCNFYQHLDRSHMLNITNSHPGTHATSINTSTEVTCSTLQTVTPVPMYPSVHDSSRGVAMVTNFWCQLEKMVYPPSNCHSKNGREDHNTDVYL